MFPPWGRLERFIKQESHISAGRDSKFVLWIIIMILEIVFLITQHSTEVGLRCRTVSKQMGQQEEVVVWEGNNFTTEWQHGPQTDHDIQFDCVSVDLFAHFSRTIIILEVDTLYLNLSVPGEIGLFLLRWGLRWLSSGRVQACGRYCSLWHKQKLRAIFSSTQGGCVPSGEQLI